MDKLSWKPHEKSMTLEQLATHVAEIPEWVPITLEQPELDFSKATISRNPLPRQRFIKNPRRCVAAALKSIQNTSAEILVNETWTMRNGETIYFTMPKIAVLRAALP